MKTMKRILRIRLAPHVMLFSIVVSSCLCIGLVCGMGLLKLHNALSGFVALGPTNSPWGIELLLAQQRDRPSVTEEAQEPWGRDEILYFVAANFKGLGLADKRELARAIHEESRIFGLAPQLILSVISVESDGDPSCQSPDGALGLMQIKPEVARDLAQEVRMPWSGRDSLLQPATNVRFGMRYLFQMVLRYQDLPLALSAYCMGPSKLDKLLSTEQEVPQQYVNRVLGLYHGL
jgi:soluble lytic murein transglycosylase-like protein